MSHRILTRGAFAASLASACMMLAPPSAFGPPLLCEEGNFGDSDVLAELLKAGADRTIRNDEGRTPLEQARYYKLSHFEALLN